jgi:hypothetical protein
VECPIPARIEPVPSRYFLFRITMRSCRHSRASWCTSCTRQCEGSSVQRQIAVRRTHQQRRPSKAPHSIR